MVIGVKRCANFAHSEHSGQTHLGRIQGLTHPSEWFWQNLCVSSATGFSLEAEQQDGIWILPYKKTCEFVVWGLV